MQFYERFEKSTTFHFESNDERAWRIGDIADVVSNMAKAGFVILGGDILDSNFSYTYDNWYYDTNSQLNAKQNIDNSISVCNKYINDYINKNGVDYYVIVVAKKITS